MFRPYPVDTNIYGIKRVFGVNKDGQLLEDVTVAKMHKTDGTDTAEVGIRRLNVKRDKVLYCGHWSPPPREGSSRNQRVRSRID